MMSEELVDCKRCEHLRNRAQLPYCKYWDRWIDPKEKKVCTAKRIRKGECSICKNEFELYDLFCLNSCRGAKSHCVDCVLVCESCLRNLKKCLERLS